MIRLCLDKTTLDQIHIGRVHPSTPLLDVKYLPFHDKSTIPASTSESDLSVLALLNVCNTGCEYPLDTNLFQSL